MFISSECKFGILSKVERWRVCVCVCVRVCVCVCRWVGVCHSVVSDSAIHGL